MLSFILEEIKEIYTVLYNYNQYGMIQLVPYPVLHNLVYTVYNDFFVFAEIQLN